MKMPTTATPSNTESAPPSTAAMVATPRATHAVAAMTRRLLLRGCSNADSVIAATGGMRAAAIAGTAAAKSVVKTPAINVTRTVPDVTMRPRDGTPRPSLLSAT
ncbi:unannotated protein [freshwater metagenome]|uniref:Unannotated protein n=1 Tax=freshwater metagenome TaxID=449393 RepID=A0A6J6NJE2_9ZZZZ